LIFPSLQNSKGDLVVSIAMVGCGGINSWSAKYLREIVDDFKRDDTIVKIFDSDEVEEKNIFRNNQNFTIDDIGSSKAETIAKRYGFLFENCFITEESVSKLEPYDYVILGVDNRKTRKLIYDYCLKKHMTCLDLTAQGTIMSYNIIDGTKPIEYYDQKYFGNPEVMERKGSCQLQSDIDNDHIENANRSIACIGMLSIFLKIMRKEKVSTDEWKFVY